METLLLTEIGIYLLILVILFPFVVYTLAKKNLFFTLLDTGNIKYIYRGDTLLKIIADVDKFKVSRYELVLGDEKRTWVQKTFGIYWMGIPPFATIRTFKVKRKREVEEAGGKPPQEWIRDLGEIKVDSLRFAFPRPFLFQEVELKIDRQAIDFLTICKFIVVDAYLPVPELKGDFFELAGSIIKGSVIDKVKDQKTIEKFLSVEKGTGGFLRDLTDKESNLNVALKKQVGLRLVGIVISEWNPTDPATREAMNKRFIAEKIREAELIAADTHKQIIAIRTEADAKAAERLAVSRAARIRKTLEAIAAKGGNPDEIVRATARIFQAEGLTNLTTLVEGGSGISPVVPVKNGGEK